MAPLQYLRGPPVDPGPFLNIGCLLICSLSRWSHCFNNIELPALGRPIHVCLWYFLYGGSKSVFIIPTSATNTTGCNADPNHNRASMCFRDGCRRSVLYLAKAWYFKGGLSVKNLHGPTVQRHISWVVATVVGHACLIWHRCYMTQPFLGDRHKEHSFSQCWTRGHSRVRRYYIDWCLCIEDEYMDMSV